MAAVRRLLVRTISSAAMGNRPSGGRKSFANGSITTVKPAPLEEEREQLGSGGGEVEGSATQCTVTKRWEYRGNNSTEVSISSTTSSVAGMLIVPSQRGSFGQGPPFAPLSLCDLKQCKLYFQLIQRLVRLPASQWMTNVSN